MAGTVTTTKVKNEYLSGARDGTTMFKGALAAYKGVRAAEVLPTPTAGPVWIVGPTIVGDHVRAVKDCPSIIGAPAVQSGQVYRYVAWGYWKVDDVTVQAAGGTFSYVPLDCVEGVIQAPPP